VGQRLARALGLPLIEGDEFHPPPNIEKMRQGMPLSDSDRAGWLEQLGQELARHDAGAVLTCSALKRTYRDILRAAAPGLRFVHLSLSQDEALRRVAARDSHFYPPSLVASQFEALEEPGGEPGVVVLDASLPVDDVVREAARALGDGGGSDSTIRN
jgi:gluconokinase